MKLLRLLMLPSNRVCDKLAITGQHERGMMRMFVNMSPSTVSPKDPEPTFAWFLDE